MNVLWRCSFHYRHFWPTKNGSSSVSVHFRPKRCGYRPCRGTFPRVPTKTLGWRRFWSFFVATFIQTFLQNNARSHRFVFAPQACDFDLRSLIPTNSNEEEVSNRVWINQVYHQDVILIKLSLIGTVWSFNPEHTINFKSPTKRKRTGPTPPDSVCAFSH